MRTVRYGDRGVDIAALQKAIGIMPDGVFGPKTESCVKSFQQHTGLKADGICGPLTWSKLQKGPRFIKEIILHCEATPEGEEFPRATLDACHKARRFSPYKTPEGKTEYIGYHIVVHLDGSVERCRPENVAGCHCSGHNAESIGVSYVGGCPARSVPDWQRKSKDTRTPRQRAALRAVVDDLMMRYPGATVHGHYEFSNKPCPSFKICDL